jgi:Predicted metal-binding protein related to the C-terminal domain of SecA
MKLEQVKQYLNESKKLSFDESIKCQLKQLKIKDIDLNDENAANEIWCLETINEIQQLFISAFNNIKNGKHFDAWRSYDLIDIKLGSLRKHFNYCNNECDLMFIETYSRKYQKLFPYEYFTSRESIIKKESCSICGHVNTIRNRCEHEVGGLYKGEMCVRKVEDIEFIAMAIVKNPFDKYTVLFPKDMEYNYEALDTLFGGLNTPYDRWNLVIENKLKPEFAKAERNKPCPCGSGAKYKKCCQGTDLETIVHYKVTLLDNPNVKPIPYKKLGTWKNS